MRNKYPGICYRCGRRVEPGEGHFERHRGAWLTQHATCTITFRDTGHLAPGFVLPEKSKRYEQMDGTKSLFRIETLAAAPGGYPDQIEAESPEQAMRALFGPEANWKPNKHGAGYIVMIDGLELAVVKPMSF